MDYQDQQSTPPNPPSSPSQPENMKPQPPTLVQKYGKWKVFIGAVILVAIMEMLAIYFLNTEADLKFFNLLEPTAMPTAINNPTPSQIPTQSSSPTTPEGTQSPQDTMCGGFAGVICPTGYECKLDGDYPDAAGKCAKK